MIRVEGPLCWLCKQWALEASKREMQAYDDGGDAQRKLTCQLLFQLPVVKTQKI